MPRFDAFTESNSIGLHHSENQDSFLVDNTNLLAAVADGVGGYAGAKDASSYAISFLKKNAERIKNEESLELIINQMHQGIRELARKLRFANMGTTLATIKLLPEESQALVGNVGDSPILLFRENEMVPVYEDDSNRSSDPSSMFGIIQYLGLDCKLQVHTKIIEFSHGDVLLLCTDGITDNLLNSKGGKEKLALLATAFGAKEIVRSSIEQGIKPDDMTAVLVSL